jgi:DNA-nicking Smr family endonuclease
MSKSVLHVDLHPLAKSGRAIDEALWEAVAEAERKRMKSIEIIPGKGTGQLMKRVKKFFDQKDVKFRYKRIEVDAKNHGRLFVHFR